MSSCCSERRRCASPKRWPDKHTHNPEDWIAAALDSLLKQGLVKMNRQSKPGWLITTKAGDDAISALVAPPNPEPPHTVAGKSKRKKRIPEEEWFAVAANLMKDGLPDAAIARRVGIARSTLSSNKRWKNARKLFTLADRRPRHFEKRDGVKQPLPMAEEDPQDDSDNEMNDEKDN